MSCCGKKRAELAKASRTPPPVALIEAPLAPPRQTPRVFEYMGVATLTVRGLASGTIYTFAARGSRVEVSYEDTFAMFGERDLRPVIG